MKSESEIEDVEMRDAEIENMSENSEVFHSVSSSETMSQDEDERPRKKFRKAKEQSTKDCGGVSWVAEKVLCQRLDIPEWVSHNVKNMMDEGCTVPFIARYRKEKTNNMEADRLREFQMAYEELKAVETRVNNVLKAVVNLGKLTEDLKNAIQASQTLTEVEHLYAPYKPGNKRSLAERAKELGLEEWADKVLEKPWWVDLNLAVKPGHKGLSNMQEVEKGVQHIVADRIAKDKDTLCLVREIINKKSNVLIESQKVKSSAKKVKEGGPAAAGNQEHKYENYFSFSCSVRDVKPHAILAINRGESQKILSVKITINDIIKQQFYKCWHQKWIHRQATQNTVRIIENSIEDCYTRLVHPLLVRGFRSDLNKTAEKAAIDVFATNLKNLLLTPPVRGKVVMGLDPGYRNGCKFAITSVTGKVLDTGVVYLHNKSHSEVLKLKASLLRNNCETVAIGNGTACRMAESVISDGIKAKTFSPLNVSYCIVNENGASIYSASVEAKKELPGLDITVRGAVSIARRLQDPLVELVKIDPKHIGVGMYQHDVSEKELKSSLEGIVQECVSFVGIDLNVCTEYLLQHVSGLNSTRARNIIKWREENGMFTNREQLLAVKGLGPKSYEQCAGFVRILPKTSLGPDTYEYHAEFLGIQPKTNSSNQAEAVQEEKKGTKRKIAAKVGTSKSKKLKLSASHNPLDMTCIHPESYPLTHRLMDAMGIRLVEVGSTIGVNKAKRYMTTHNIKELAEEYGVGFFTMKLITDGLQQAVDHDIRQEFEKPLFRQGLMSMEDLKKGQKCTGKVVNVTHFGAFVDIGVGQDGLIHTSKMPVRILCRYDKEKLDLGDRVEVTIQTLDIDKKRIGLALQKVL